MYANQLVDAVQGVILPKHAWGALPFEEWRDNPQWFVDHFVASGPFMLERWDPNERLILVRNPRYFAEDRPPAERIVVQITPDQDSRLAELRAGRSNFVAIQPSQVAQVEDHPAIEVISYAYRQNVFVTWNVSNPLFEDARVRRALTLAIDRQAIIDTLYFGFAQIPASPFLVDAWVYNRALEPLPYDLAAARDLLAEAGWRDHDQDGIADRDGKPFRFALMTNTGNQTRMDIVVMIQEQLKRVGIDAQPTILDFNTVVERAAQHDFEAMVMGLGMDTSFDMTSMLHSSAFDEGINWGMYHHPDVDRMIDEIKRYDVQLDAKDTFDALQVLLQEEQPMTLLYQPRRLIATRGLSNVRPNALSVFFNIRHWQPVAEP